MASRRVSHVPLRPPQQRPLGGRVVSLALQGGASLGAYTWGVLDAMLADGRLTIDGVTGASAGALNAVALGAGLATGGNAGARATLRAFWERLSHNSALARRGRFDFLRAFLRALPRLTSRESFYALTTRLVADFHIDPETMDPLRRTLVETVDFAALARPDAPKVFVNLTDVQTGEPAVFSGAQIDADVVCASCAVPFLFRPVEIGGRHFWDGGLLGNPAIYPVIYECAAPDVVLVETLAARADVPRTAADVLTRAMELASIAGLVRELRTIRFVTEMLREAPREGMREIRLHHIPPHAALATVEGKSGFAYALSYFERLRDLGGDAGRDWLGAALPVPDGLAPAPRRSLAAMPLGGARAED